MRRIATASALLIFFLLLTTFVRSQNEFRIPPTNNFDSIKKAAEIYFADPAHHDETILTGNDEDNDYLRYKRWEWYWSTRLNPDGTFPDLAAQGNAYRACNAHAQNARMANNANAVSVPQWSCISQTVGDGGYSGMGRATAIAFDPNDSDIFFVGAPIGGIWKTTDGGNTFTPLGDSLPYVSAGTIAVDWRNPDNLYITLGDCMGWWNYGLGVYKSTNGGQTWNATSHTSSFVTGVAYYQMAMSPSSPDTILLAESDGLYRTADAGNTWTLVHSGAHRDVCFKPGSGDTVYASTDDYWGSSEVYRSIDGGITWTVMTSFGQNYNTIHLTTTPVYPDLLGISCTYSSTMNYYLSLDCGNTNVLRSFLPESAVIYASPTDTSILYAGGVDLWGSTDGGTNWTRMTNWYDDQVHPTVHADKHYAAFNPLNGCSYFCTDGGVFRLRESNDMWAELNNTFVTTQFYRLAVSQMDPMKVIGGTQDNGGRKRIGAVTWAATNGGDAMDNAINEVNDQTIYTTYCNGLLYRSYDYWTWDTYNVITPPGSTGSWVTPYVLDPNNQDAIIAGYQDVYWSGDEGQNWSQLSTNLTGSSTTTLSCLAVAKANSNVIYTSEASKIHETHDFGANWTTHLTPLGTSNFTSITSICFYPGTTDVIYITGGGYTGGKKVYKSTDGGVNWTNISYSLPNIPVNCAMFNKASFFHDYYIGTDVGVFMINDTMSDWMYYGSGLPNTSVTDLEIQYSSGKLLAATYGRGIWEIAIDGTTGIDEPVMQNVSQNYSLVMNPVNETLLMDAHLANGNNSVFEIFDVSGKKVMEKDQYTPAGNYRLAFDVASLSPGMYFIRTLDENGEAVTLKFVKE